MGKNTGFLDYTRTENGNFEPLLRIKNFKEFHPFLDDVKRREQAARCMNCGVPMCQSAIKLAGMVTGCPLHNYIPEWNDALYQGQYDMAAWRLLKTSSFPEFVFVLLFVKKLVTVETQYVEMEQLLFTTTNFTSLKRLMNLVI